MHLLVIPIAFIIPNMPTAADFQKYLSSKLSSSSDKEELILQNYLRYFCAPSEKLCFELLQNFYRKILCISYWQNRLQLLEQALTSHLADFAKQHHWPGFELEQMASISGWQWIKLHQLSDLEKLVKKSLQKDMSPGDQIKVFPYTEERVLALILKLDGGLKVMSFGPMAIIRSGTLEPLTALSELYYLPSYELSPYFTQVLENLNKGFICFKHKNHKWIGGIYRENDWQELDHFIVTDIRQKPELFARLKHIEHQYIQAETDPHYQSLIKSLHTCYRQMLLDPDTALSSIQRVLSEARMAIRSLYPNSRLLVLLTANIEFHLQKKQNGISFQSTCFYE